MTGPSIVTAVSSGHRSFVEMLSASEHSSPGSGARLEALTAATEPDARRSRAAQLSKADVLVVSQPADVAAQKTLRKLMVTARTLGVRACCIVSDPEKSGGLPAEPIRLFAIAAGFEVAATMSAGADLPAKIISAVSSLAPRTAPGLRATIEQVAAAGGRVVARVHAGTIALGDTIVVLPGAQSAKVATSTAAGPGTVSLEFAPPISAAAGRVVCHAEHRPEVTDQVAAHVIWLDDKPMLPGRPYDIEVAGQLTTMQVSALKHVLNFDNLDHIAARTIEPGAVAFCNLSFERDVVFDPIEICRATGLARIYGHGGRELVGFATIAFPLRRATNIHWQALAVDKGARSELKGQRPCCLWFTGLSGSGKSTVASLLEKRLHALGRHTYTLDGDNVRHGLNRDLGFTDADRVENIRRVAEVAKLFVDSGVIVMVSFISPFRAERELARELFTDGEFIEIYVDTPLEVCEQRDPKGLYKKARAGQLKNFTGIDSSYEPPNRAEIVLPGARKNAEALVEDVLAALAERRRI